MIRINLARQLPNPQPSLTGSGWAYGFAGVLILVLSLGCWWWTEMLQVRLRVLQEDKTSKAQTLDHLQKKLGSLVTLEEQKNLLVKSLEGLNGKSNSVPDPAVLLDRIGQNLENLGIWLEKVRIEHGAVEIHGRSLSVEDVGKCLDRLEKVLAFQSLPQLEIHDHTGESTADFSFFIRFSVQGDPVA